MRIKQLEFAMFLAFPGLQVVKLAMDLRGRQPIHYSYARQVAFGPVSFDLPYRQDGAHYFCDTLALGMACQQSPHSLTAMPGYQWEQLHEEALWMIAGNDMHSGVWRRVSGME